MKKNVLLSLACLSPSLLLAQSDKPNIMIIMTDDMGYSDIGCYGGEIETPNIDGLAQNGLRFTQFYTNARCCPTRASLMTGLYAHQVGLTFNGNSLTTDNVTIAEALKQVGYNTGMTGKWHLSRTQARSSHEEQLDWLAHQADYGDFAPLGSYPSNRGFDQHYGVIWGVVNFFDPFSLVHNEDPIPTVPDDFYFTDYVTDKTIDLIDAFSADKENPFFLYVAHAAPHWPLHALPEDIAKYDGVYDDGWDVLRDERYNRMIEMGLFDPDILPEAPNESHRTWADEPDKVKQADNMEVHAAMVDRVDQGIGRVIDKLKATGEYDNTIIFFFSDNGASYEGGYPPGFDRPGYTRESEEIHVNTDNPGPETTWNYLGNGWAGALNAPFRYWKTEAFAGGICTPMVVHWPNGLQTQPGSLTNQVGHVIDILPTCLDLAGASYPSTYNGNEVQPMEGESLIDIINGGTRIQPEAFYFEHEGGRGLIAGTWKLVALDGGPWQLYDLSTDLSETINLSADYPEKVDELKEMWNQWAEKVGLPIPPDIPDTPLEAVFYYPFDDDLTDGSMNNHELQDHNGYSFSEGMYGQALELDGSQYLDLNTSGLVDPSNTQFTVCAWVNKTATTMPSPENFYEEVVLAQKDGSFDNAGRIALYYRQYADNGSYNNFLAAQANMSTPGSFKRNEWQHVAVVCDPANWAVSYYIGGIKDTTVYTSGNFESCTGGFRIGAHKTGNKDFWHGKIDELYLF
jgi:arylsulfatase A-like enzyme